MSFVAHALICYCAEIGIMNFEYFVIFVIFFSTPENQFKTEKKPVFLIKVFLFFCNKYYVIFKSQNSNFGTLANQRMGYQGHKTILLFGNLMIIGNSVLDVL